MSLSDLVEILLGEMIGRKARLSKKKDGFRKYLEGIESLRRKIMG